MLTSSRDPSSRDFELVAERAPTGALALCGIAVALVMGIWFAFYFLAFLPRGHLQ